MVTISKQPEVKETTANKETKKTERSLYYFRAAGWCWLVLVGAVGATISAMSLAANESTLRRQPTEYKSIG